MATTKTGFLKFKAPGGEVVERPQEEIQSLRQAGFNPLPGQSLYFAKGDGVNKVPVENISRAKPTENLSILSADEVFNRVAEQEYGGLGGAAKALAYGVGQGFTSDLGGAAALGAGAVNPESLAMIEKARPGVKFAGEVVGTLGQVAAASALTGIGGPIAGVGKAFGGLSKAVQFATRGAAMGGAYGLGSELTQAQIEGREARPLEAAAIGAGTGIAAEFALPLLGKGLSKAKGFVGGLRDAAVEGDAGKAASMLDAAKNKSQSAATAAAKKAADAEVARLQKIVDKQAADAAKAAGINAVDQGIVSAGTEAETALNTYKTEKGTSIQASLKQVEDAMTTMGETRSALILESLPEDAKKAIAKLTGDLEKNAQSLASVGSKIESEMANKEAARGLFDAKKSLSQVTIEADTLVASEAAKVAEAQQALAIARQSQASSGTIRRLEAALEKAVAARDHFTSLGTAAKELLAASISHTEAVSADNIVASSVRAADAEQGKLVASIKKLDESIAGIVPSEAIPAAGDVAAAATAVTDAAAQVATTAAEAGFRPSTIIEFGKKLHKGTLSSISNHSLGRVLEEAAASGHQTVSNVISQLLGDGFAAQGKTFGTTANKIAEELIKNPKIIGYMNAQERGLLASKFLRSDKYALSGPNAASIREKLAGVTGKGSAKGLLGTLPSIERAAAQAAAPTLAEAAVGQEAAAVATAAAESSLSPAAAFSARDTEAYTSKVAERAALNLRKNAVEKIGRILEAAKSETESSRREAYNRLRAAQADAAATRSTGASNKADVAVQNALDTLNAANKSMQAIEAAQQNLANAVSERGAARELAAGGSPTLQEALANAHRVVSDAKFDAKIAEAGTKQTALQRQAENINRQLNEATRASYLQDEANAIIMDVQKNLGLKVLEKQQLTNQYFVQSQETVFNNFMKQYYDTDVGKKLLGKIADAAKASERLAQRETAAAAEAAAKAVPVGQAVKDAASDPAVLISALTAGPAAGFTVLAAQVASRASGKGIRGVLTALAPMWAYDGPIALASTLQKAIDNKVVASAVKLGAQKGAAVVTRSDVEKAKTEVDEILNDEKDAANAFKSSVDSVRVNPDKYLKLEEQYREVIGELEKRRPKTFGKGAPSAEEEDFVKAYNIIRDSDAISRSIKSGTLSQAEADMIKKVSPDAYKAMADVLSVANREHPQNVSPVMLQRFGIRSKMGLPISQVMSLIGQPQQGQPQQESLGTRRPGKKSSISESASLNTRIGGGTQG